MHRLVNFLLLAVLIASALAYRSFHGDVVLRLTSVDTTEEIAFVRNLRDHPVWDVELDWWDGLDVRVPAKHRAAIEGLFAANNISYRVMIDDVQALVAAEQIRLAKRAPFSVAQSLQYGASAAPAFFDDYHPLDEILAFFKGLVQQHPDKAEMVVVGRSYEGRDIVGMRINVGNSTKKMATFYEGGIHAREWVAHSTVTYIGWRLLNDYGTDSVVTTLLDNIEYFIIPSVNPDGYVYSWTDDRMWRKTRMPNKGSSCVGTDPNRNWDDHFCSTGGSRNPCSEAYCGIKPFDQIECKSIAEWILKNKFRNFKEFRDFHSYSQLWMRPWGWTADLPEDAATQEAAGLLAQKAIKNTHGTHYEEGPSFTVVYPAAGGSDDWAYSAANITWSGCTELRDTGRFGFLLPPEQIVPTGEENFAAVKEVGKYILSQI